MLELAIEIEGLIRILKDGSPSAETYSLLKKKTEALSDMVNDIAKNDIAKRDSSQNDMPTYEPLPHNGTEGTAEHDPISDADDSPTIPESAIELEKETDQQLEAAEAVENKSEYAENDSKSEPDATPVVTEHEETPVVTEDEDDDILLSFDDEKDESKDIEEENAVTVKSREDNPHEGGRKVAENLKSAFSLNDRFLYSRELFDGDMKMFDSTIKSLEGVDDFGVVEDYFYNEMEWDRENPIVQAFMERLQSKFK